MAEASVIDIGGVSKSFGTMRALDDVSLTVRRGTLHAILGENGAGKSTLLRVVAGLLPPDTVSPRSAGGGWTVPPRAAVGIVHQHSALVPAMTAAENFALASPHLLRRFAPSDIAAQMAATAERAGIAADPTAIVERASIAERQRIEIIRAIAASPTLLLLDEPTAVLPPQEARALYGWLRRYVEGGATVVVVTHRLSEVLAFADDVTVMRRGRSVMTADRAAFDEVRLLAAILGETPATASGQASPAAPRHDVADRVAWLDSVEVDGGPHRVPVRVARLDIHRGEIVGVAGIEGAGQWTLLRVIANRIPASRGVVGRVSTDIGFIPEDRQVEGFVGAWGADDNLALRGAGKRRGRFDPSHLAARAATLVERFDVRGLGERAAVKTLSGGNQQKLLLAREMEPRPDLLVAENPVRGLDVRAAAFVRSQLREIAGRGAGVVVYSSDLDDVLALSDRIVVCHAGHVLDAPHDAEAVGRLMIAGTA